ncbi:aspartate/glutamate racemase family protein [Pandoraea nosoerga]|uniref:Glutamate racemase n=1 Tax=Pandoraea nosoerga TaxID=2508296 RepID=A0A5E4RBU2_9BURK|nr:MULTISPECIES: aspartate/glutamate racemase family protein [Pandoraea]MBN4666719.1 aspartate/glutamate racemase family protein [Pandoraea nosoerga]MBN4676867.1 aspartate/glutamate racemase family protein [Pandoraea nosoerga]MBN4681526.1 aspartate/glutamate racemase family protein [Pandoraea nosoerga]MBN4745986.1 aspartate/glutamate racemase family protein [Pandoraea nosoerga]VVD60677.1 Glutamate racemase [Pandoraea nosoerga]
MQPTILVLNPNSLSGVTRRIAETASVQFRNAPVRLAYATLADAPPGIATQRDAERAAVLAVDAIERNLRGADAADAFVLACYSDPGLAAAREVTRRPVIGIGQAALGAATALGERIGVVAITAGSIARHWRAYRAHGIAQKIVGERAVDLTVAESGDDALAIPRIVDTGRALVEQDGADVIVLGCAGMAALRARIEDALGVPVVEPCTTAISLACNVLAGVPR